MSILVTIVILLALSAIYVAAEFATVAAKTLRIEALAEHGNAAARRLLPYVKDANALDRYVATCQIGITVASLVLGALGEKHFTPILWKWFVTIFGTQPFGCPESASRPVISILVVLLFTGLQLVFGELVPKAVAVRYTERTALILSWPMMVSLRVLAIFIDIFNGSSDLILRAFHVKLGSERHVHTLEELSTLVEHSATSDPLDDVEKKRIKRILRFNKRCARDIMVPRNRMVCVNLEAPRSEIISTVVNSPYTRFPVYQGSEDKIIGILHLKDLLFIDLRGKELGNKQKSIATLKKMIRKSIVFCPASMSVDKVLDKLRDNRAYMAVLEDEYGGTDGLLTIEDILEEILGDINDEFDSSTEDAEIKRLGEGEYQIAGTMVLDELKEAYGIDLIIDDVHTLGGLVMHLAEEVPQQGYVTRYNGYDLKVEKMRERQVLKVRVRKVAQS